MPMLTYHPRFGPRSPSRAQPRLGATTIKTADQAIAALKAAYCEKRYQGFEMGVSEIMTVANSIIDNAKKGGMSTLTAISTLAQMTSLAYDMANGSVNCPKPATPPPAPAPTASGGSATTALAIGGALIGAALLARR